MSSSLGSIDSVLLLMCSALLAVSLYFVKELLGTIKDLQKNMIDINLRTEGNTFRIKSLEDRDRH